MSEFLEVALVLPARDDMITPSLESTSCLNSGIVEPVLPSVLNGKFTLFCPSCPLSRESSHVVAFLTDWCQICLLLISSNMHCQLQCIPWLGLVLSQIGWWTPIVSAAKLAGNLVAHRWSLFQIVLEKQRELSVARKTWRASLSGDSLALFGSWDFPLFQRLLDEADYEDKHLLHDISCLPLTGLAPVSGVLSPKSVHATVSLCPSFGLRFLNVMLKCSIALVLLVTPSWIVAQVTKLTKSLPLASWTDRTTPLKSVLESTRFSCAENLVGKVEMFATPTIARKTGSMKHLSPRRHTSLPVLTTTFLCNQIVGNFPSWCHASRVCCRFVEAFELHCRFLVPNTGSRRFGRLRGCPFGAAACVQGCARLPMAMCALLQHHLLVRVQHYQDDHHCVEPSYSVAQAWTLMKQFYGLLGPKLATPGGEKFPFPAKFIVCLAPKLTSTVSPREIQVLPRESILFVVSSNRSWRPRN